MKKITRLCLLLFLAVAGNAVADNFPSRPIKIIVPWPAGGPADQRARQVAEKLTGALSQAVIVENRGGASGAIGALAAAKAPPDGYTLLYGTVYDLCINPVINPAQGYEPLRDFAPITQVAFAYLVLDTRPGLGVRSIKELIALARATPGKLSGGSPGNATAAHFALEVLKRSAGIDITHVPFKGDAPLINDLLGGHVDIGFNVTTSALPHIKAGNLIPLLVSSPNRLAAFPDVAVANELGYPELEIILWGGVLAPSGTPAEVIKRLNSALVKIIDNPEFSEQMSSGGALAHSSTPEEFTTFMRAEKDRWTKRINQTGVKME